MCQASKRARTNQCTNSDRQTSKAFLSPEGTELDPFDIEWEGVLLKCHSQYEVLGLVFSVLGRAPPRATRRYVQFGVTSFSFGSR